MGYYMPNDYQQYNWKETIYIMDKSEYDYIYFDSPSQHKHPILLDYMIDKDTFQSVWIKQKLHRVVGRLYGTNKVIIMIFRYCNVEIDIL